MSSLCWECKYEHSDCKGDKWIEKVACPYFSKKLAINYPKVIEELERKVEFFESLYQGQLDANEKLLLRKETLEAQNEELKAELKQADEAYDSQGKQLLEALDENEKLKEENGGNNHIVQIRHFNDYLAKMYTFNVPDGLTLKKGDYVLVETKGGTPKVAKCMTDSIRVNDEMLYMIMQGNKVISSVIGRYDLKERDTE